MNFVLLAMPPDTDMSDRKKDLTIPYGSSRLPVYLHLQLARKQAKMFLFN